MPCPGPPYPGQDFLQMLAAITSQYLVQIKAPNPTKPSEEQVFTQP